MQKSDPSGLLIFEKLKYKAVSSSSVYNGKNSHCHLHDVPEFPVFHNYTSLMCYKHKTTEGKGFTLLLHWDIQISLHFAWEIQSLILMCLGINPTLTLSYKKAKLTLAQPTSTLPKAKHSSGNVRKLSWFLIFILSKYRLAQFCVFLIQIPQHDKIRCSTR